ncbi:unnamed protein product [Leptidea sinapis]|uniref:Uncharacterized protein n=1 Tax=Leptidea sinapis TaxID=189913 RepID=A0A5E4QMJ4_9NEOP|nr:unnamed protein product [Leptidea sinapis]
MLASRHDGSRRAGGHSSPRAVQEDSGVGAIADALLHQSMQTPPSAPASPLSPQVFPRIVRVERLSRGIQPSRGRYKIDVQKERTGCFTSTPSQDQPHLSHTARYRSTAQVQTSPSPSRPTSRFSVSRNYNTIYNFPFHPTVQDKVPDIVKCEQTTVQNVKSDNDKVDIDVKVDSVKSDISIDKVVDDIARKIDVKNRNVVNVNVSEEHPETNVKIKDLDNINSKTNICGKECAITMPIIVLPAPKHNIATEIGTQTDNKNLEAKDKQNEFKTQIQAENKTDTGAKKVDSIVTEIVTEIEPLEVTLKNKSVIHGPNNVVRTELPPICLLSSENIESNTQNTNLDSKGIQVANTVRDDSVCIDDDLKRTIDSSKHCATSIKNNVLDNISNSVKIGDLVNIDSGCNDKIEQLTYSVTVKDLEDIKMVKTETKLVKDIVAINESEIRDVEKAVTIKNEQSSLKTKVHNDQNVNIDNKQKGDVAIKEIEAIAANLGSLIKEMHDLSTKNWKKDEIDLRNVVPAIRESVVLKKNKKSSMESASEVTPMNLNVSMSSNESVSPIIFGGSKKIHDSLSSLEASVSSLESARLEKMMVLSADSGIEHSLQHPSEIRDDSSSNEGTLTNSGSLKDSTKSFQDALTSAKRTSSLLDVPALKTKGLERMRKISWVAPSPSFHIPKPDTDKVENKFPTNLEKLLSLFQHPSSLFSRATSEDERKSTSSTPPRKDSSLTNSFWLWASSSEKSERDDKDAESVSEATDSTLSERIQISFVDESFSKKLDSKTPSTDTENTLSEFQTFPVAVDNVTEVTTDENLVQKSLELSINADSDLSRTRDNTDLIVPNENDATRTVESNDECNALVKLDAKPIEVRPRSFASVLKSTSSDNSMDKLSPDAGQPIDKLPIKIIKGIKENISPENTITAAMSTNILTNELTDMQIKNQTIVGCVWDIETPFLDKGDSKVNNIKPQSDLAPIANIDETCDVAADDCIQLAYIDDVKIDDDNKFIKELGSVDVGKDALSYLEFETQNKTEQIKQPESLAQELKLAEIKDQLVDLSPELVVDESSEIPEVFTMEIKGMRSSPVIPERAKMKKSNSLEDLTKRLEKESPKMKTIAFKVPESTRPRDIPERRSKLRPRTGSSPKSLPESLNKPCPLSKMDSILSKKKKKVSSLGKMARDSLLALNMSEEEIAEFRRSYKLTSVESLKSLESVSEDANSQSGTSFDSRCRACLRTSQESLMSLDSITEDCRCSEFCEKKSHTNR